MEYRPFYLAREWVRQGHRVTIVAASFSHLRVNQPKISGAITEENLDGIRYVWLKTPHYQGNGVWRVLNMMWFVVQLLRFRSHVAGDDSPDAVVASSPHPLLIYPAHRIARKFDAKLLFEVRDLWPLTLVELGRISARHPLNVLLQCAENFAYRKADWVVSLLPHAASHMTRHGMSPEKFIYIPNGVDPAEWKEISAEMPSEHQEILTGLNKGGSFLVGYAGQHGVLNALDAIVAAAKILQNESVTFVLIGQGPEKNRLQEECRDLGLANVVFLPPVAKHSLRPLLASMDALYIGMASVPLFRFGVSPNKLMDYMMAAKPVIHAIEAGNNLVAESGCGLSCPPEDPQAIADAVRQMTRMSSAERETMGRLGKTYVEQRHSFAVLGQKFLELMDTEKQSVQS